MTPRFVFKLYIRLSQRFYALIVANLVFMPLTKKKIEHHTKRRILRDKRDKAYNMKTVDNNPYSAIYVIYFNPGPSISPPQTSISIEVYRRWNQAFFPDVYTWRHSVDWCPRQTRCSFRVFTPFTIDSIIPLPSTATPNLWGRASEIRLWLISPGGKKRVFSVKNTSSQRSIPFESNNPYRWSSMKGKREKKSGADGYDHGNAKYSDISYCCHVGQIIRL